MHNYWLKKKDIKVKSVNIKYAKGSPTIVNIELTCGRKYKCLASTEHSESPMLNTMFNSYTDERFYKEGNRKDEKGRAIYESTEPWDESLFTARYDVVEKVALSILLRIGELRYEDYKDVYDYYAAVEVGVGHEAYELPSFDKITRTD